MPSAATLRREIEHALEHRFPSALTLTPQTIREAVPTGIQEIDTFLGGGIPLGAISEVMGQASSGRTSLAMSIVALRTRSGQACAWVDADDAFDPESAAANGVDLNQCLWVRCQDQKPRGRIEHARSSKSGPWRRLDQALRATDLLLQAGGFAVIVLDLGDTAPQHGRRIPLATWFRFRQAADHVRSCLVVLGKASYAQSGAALVLECAQDRVAIAGQTVLRSFSFRVDQQRQRFTPRSVSMRKPPVSTWSAASQWAVEERG